MDGRRSRSSRRLATILGAAAGTACAVALAAITDTGTAQQPAASPEPWIEATHLPPLLTAAGEPVELRYDAFCVVDDGVDVDMPCDVQASVYARRGAAGRFEELAVREELGSPDGRFVAPVPPSLAGSPSGFSYYAVLRDRRTGATTTLPAGGAVAPQRSRPLGRAVEISLEPHRFGELRRASARVVEAPWGAGPGAVGLEHGRSLPPTGGSSFDVASDGTVHVLDEANRRVLRWAPRASRPDELPVAVNGTIADLAVGHDGTMYVLETTAELGEAPTLRAFEARGRPIGASRLAERASQLRLAPHGDAEVLQEPSGQWMSAYEHGRPTGRERQLASGRSGRAVGGGRELVVLRKDDEIRVALVGDGVSQAWRVTSPSPIAEVQLAEALGRNVLLVVRAYSDTQDEFRVLVLGARGVVESFSVASADWAETAPLSRFRLRGSVLYQLGSTPRGLFVDRFDLEVR